MIVPELSFMVAVADDDDGSSGGGAKSPLIWIHYYEHCAHTVYR